MRSSLTRSHLKDLEGQQVVYKSFYVDRKKPIDGSFKILLQNVKLCKWDPEIPIYKTVFTHTCDHCWIVLPEIDSYGYNLSNYFRMQRYSKGFGLGTVGYYSRSDGSIDLSVTPFPFLSLDRVPDLNPDRSNIGRLIQMFKGIELKAERYGMAIVSQYYGRSQCLKYVKDRLKYLEELVHADASRSFHKFRNNKVTSPKSFKDLIHRSHARSSSRLAPAEQSRILRSILPSGCD